MKNQFIIVDYPKKKVINARQPKEAAKIAFTRLCKELKYNNREGTNYIKFVLKEVGSGKEYPYLGTRVELVNPVEKTMGNGKVVKYRYRNIIANYTRNMDDVFLR